VATKTLSSPIFHGGIYLEVFRERKMVWLTSISMVFSRQGHPSISQGRLSRHYYIIKWCFLQEWGFYLEGVWLWRISGAITQDDGCYALFI